MMRYARVFLIRFSLQNRRILRGYVSQNEDDQTSMYAVAGQAETSIKLKVILKNKPTGGPQPPILGALDSLTPQN